MEPTVKPGRGQRLCPSCLEIRGVRLRTCSCGHIFSASDKAAERPLAEPKPQTTYDGPGAGRKQCQACKAYVGVRTRTCICGAEFARPSSATLAEPGSPEGREQQAPEAADDSGSSDDPSPSAVYVRPKPGHFSIPMASHDMPFREPEQRFKGMGLHRIAVPAGECPAQLKGLTREAVAEWIEDVQKTFRRRNEVLTPYGYEYWLRDFHDLGTPGHAAVVALIEEIMGASVETY